MKKNPLIFILPLLLLLSTSTSTSAHNITKILAAHPEFSTFNHYLTLTHLASEINRRLTITVLALDNSAMASILDRHFSMPTLKNVLSLHCLVDYYGAKKLHQLTGGSTLSSSFFQSTGSAPGTTGFINITDHRKGHVTFTAEDDASSSSPASFVKSIKEMPYNLSIVQISAPLTSPEAEAPTAAPAPVNLTSLLSKNGCKMFADILAAIPDVMQTFEHDLDGGLTVFCPVDGAIKSFAPKYKNLTAEDKSSLVLYHGAAVYNSMQMLKQNNGVSSTLATEGTKKNRNYVYTVQNDGETVTLETKVTTAKILKTVYDQDPVAVYSIDKVLEPKELFKVAEAEAPADAPAAPKKKGKGKKKKGTVVDADAPAPGSDEAPADDQKAADENKGVRIGGWVYPMVAALVSVVTVIV